MKYLVAIAAILLLVVVLKAQGCGMLDRMRDKREQRQEQRQDQKEQRQERREDRWNPVPIDEWKPNNNRRERRRLFGNR